MRAAAAGAAAATVWGALEPLDQRLLGYGYSDIALLGKAVTRGPRWRAVGFALHAANGAVFGLAYARLGRSAPAGPYRLAIGMALAEHLALYPLNALVDRFHPARGEPWPGRPRRRGCGGRPYRSCTPTTPSTSARRSTSPPGRPFR